MITLPSPWLDIAACVKLREAATRVIMKRPKISPEQQFARAPERGRKHHGPQIDSRLARVGRIQNAAPAQTGDPIAVKTAIIENESAARQDLAIVLHRQ